MATDCEDKGNDMAWTASEMLSQKDPMLSQKEDEASSQSGSDMEWFSQSEGDKECPLEVSDDSDDEDDEDGWRVLSPEEEAAALLENSDVISVLFEMPSGFAIYGYYGHELHKSDAWKDIWIDFINLPNRAVWLKEFQTFEDKRSAIDEHQISPELAQMIKKHVVDGQTLAVGKQDYASVISSCLGIKCMCNSSVEEMMWGLEIQIPQFVRQENSELTYKDCFRMSKGMEYLLNRHNFDVKPEMMVTRHIIEKASIMYECDRRVNEHDISLRKIAAHVKKISHIDTEGWDLLKLATAIKLICYPQEKISAARRLFTKQQLRKFKKDAPKYENKFSKAACLEVYHEIYSARKIRSAAAQVLVRLVKRAKKAYEAEQAGEAIGHEIDPDSKKICHGINPDSKKICHSLFG